MSDIVKIENLHDMILEIRGHRVLLDRDLATIYGVETKRINEAVRNNPDKFPAGYLFELSEGEFADLRSKFSTANLAKTRVVPKAFTTWIQPVPPAEMPDWLRVKACIKQTMN